MIFVTGDIHDVDMGGADQDWLEENSGPTEMECAVKYGEIAREYGVPVTLFSTGKAVQQEGEQLASLIDNEFVELGGHTWNGLRPSWIHHLWKYIFGSFYGPKWFQKKDIEKTLSVLNDLTGGKIEVWRTHGYRGDSKTNELLTKAGVKVVSDEIGPDKNIMRVAENLFSVPINVPPDHEHLYHGKYDGSRRGGGFDSAIKGTARNLIGMKKREKAFGEVWMKKNDWWEWVRAETQERLDDSGFATLLLHPACMEILDGMELLKEVFEHLSSRECGFVSEAVNGVG